jgi:alkyl hydroperoxide reductase subunit AhpC
MALAISDTAPDFEAQTTEGKIRFHDWIGDKWVVLFSHPKDFTPVCTTELGYMARIKPEFDKRGVKIIGLSVDPVDSHSKWANDIKETQGHAPNYPMIGDPISTCRSSTACCRRASPAIPPSARRPITRPCATCS